MVTHFGEWNWNQSHSMSYLSRHATGNVKVLKQMMSVKNTGEKKQGFSEVSAKFSFTSMETRLCLYYPSQVPVLRMENRTGLTSLQLRYFPPQSITSGNTKYFAQMLVISKTAGLRNRATPWSQGNSRDALLSLIQFQELTNQSNICRHALLPLESMTSNWETEDPVIYLTLKGSTGVAILEASLELDSLPPQCTRTAELFRERGFYPKENVKFL